MTSLRLSVLPGRFAVCRLHPTEAVPQWAWSGEICSVTRNTDELSVVCAEEGVPDNVKNQGDWVCLKLHGPFEFNLTGILASVLNPLRDANVGIFAISTFDTDYVLVAASNLSATIEALVRAGHEVSQG